MTVAQTNHCADRFPVDNMRWAGEHARRSRGGERAQLDVAAEWLDRELMKINRGDEVLCGVVVPNSGPCESYRGHHEGEHLGPGERCTYVSSGGIRCASRLGHGDPMHNVTQPRAYR